LIFSNEFVSTKWPVDPLNFETVAPGGGKQGGTRAAKERDVFIG